MRSTQTLLHQYKDIQRPFRFLRYYFWRATGVTQLAGYWPELEPLEAIARHSSPTEFEMKEDGARVLFFTFRYWNTHAVWDALLAHALRQRGAHVSFFTCGGRLPVCDAAPHTLAPPMPCDNCAPYLDRLFSALRLPHQDAREYITSAERAEIRRMVANLRPDEFEGFEYDGLPLGDLVRPSVYWFLLSGNPERDEEYFDTYRKFLYSGAMIARAMGRRMDAQRPALIYLLNGLFFAERVVIELARRRGIEYITHEGGFFPDTQVFARNDFAPYYPLDDIWTHYQKRPLTQTEAAHLDQYLVQRWSGQRDVRQYYPNIESDIAAIYQRLDLNKACQIVTLYTNVDWDTACFAGGSIFASMDDWIEQTIRILSGQNNIQLVIRVHPGEVRLPFLEPRVKVAETIRSRFPQLPANVRIVPPESDISSYTLMEMSALNLVYTSTVGLEMVLRGLPMIAAGRGYYAGKGFTREVTSPDEYAALLSRIDEIQPPTTQEVELARRYASMFFFRHHIRFPLTQTTKGWHMQLMFNNLAELQPGHHAELDLLCNAILHGLPFVDESDL